MKQRYHSIIKLEDTGTYVGWVEEIPGALTHGSSLKECRRRLRESLELLLHTNRDEARLGLSPTCIEEAIEVDVVDTASLSSSPNPGRYQGA